MDNDGASVFLVADESKVDAVEYGEAQIVRRQIGLNEIVGIGTNGRLKVGDVIDWNIFRKRRDRESKESREDER